MAIYLVLFLFTFFVVYLLIPLTKKLAVQWNVVDRPNARKIHREPIPLSGGMAIFIGMVGTLLLFFSITRFHLVLIIGGLALVMIGFIDDRFKAKGIDFPAWPKFIVQILSAVFVFALGIRFYGIGYFWNGLGADFYVFPLWLSFFATVIWMTGFINMINFLDGMDGLAGGVATISALTFFLIGFIKGQADIAALSAILMGASLAFLRHNFHPASVFLGDAGSMFLGYVIGLTSLFGTMKSATVITIVVSLLALGVPVLDTLQVMITRIKEGRPIYLPDKRHVHHRLMEVGLTQRQAVLVIYVISIGFSFLSLLLLYYVRG